jgi:hypothetical protein
MNRMIVLLMITIFVIVIGLSLRSLILYKPLQKSEPSAEGFSLDTEVQRMEDTAHMSGYVNVKHSNPNNVYKPESGPHPSQITNVPTAKEYVIGRIKKYESHVPLKHSDKDYVIGSMDDEIVKKFSLGDVPNIILNPDSREEDQITCDIEQDCDEYVRNSNLYCPMGLDRLKNQESTGKPNEQKYQGCYTMTRNYPSLACRFGDRFNYCDYMNDLRIQRTGRGFYVFPTFDAMYAIYQNTRRMVNGRDESDNTEWNKVRYIMNIKISIIRYMILSYDHPDVNNNVNGVSNWSPWRSTGSSVLDQYARQVFYNSFLLYQSGTHKTPTRVGFIIRKDTPSYGPSVSNIPELSTPTKRHSYNLKHAKYVHDTTMDPMPVLQPIVHTKQSRVNRIRMTSD